MSHSYSSADTGVPRTGQYWDPAGEYEPADTVYTLTAYIPPRPPPKWLPAFLCREPLHVSRAGAILPSRLTPDYSCFDSTDLNDMETKTVKIKAYRFPLELRCTHVTDSKVCTEGCYVLERGEKRVAQTFCGSSDCEGHVYHGNTKENEHASCFGKKGERMVCIEGMPGRR